MPVFQIAAPGGRYPVVVARHSLQRLAGFLPNSHGKIFLVTERAIWSQLAIHVPPIEAGLLFLPGGEQNKRFSPLEPLAEEMVARGADRSSILIAFGGGIVNDMTGFLAAIFLRGVPVIQIPTTLLAQVDASIGGKTGVNLTSGKNLIGSFHQPLAVIVDPALLGTLPGRDYRAGLFEIIKYGVIANPALFDLLEAQRDAVLAREPAILDRIITESVRIKCEVVSADERESGLRRILNFGHTAGHALESETHYERFLHGEAVGFGMRVATILASTLGLLDQKSCTRIHDLIRAYGPIPATEGIEARALFDRLFKDKKTVRGHLHFVLPTRIGDATVVAGPDPALIRAALEAALASP